MNNTKMSTYPEQRNLFAIDDIVDRLIQREFEAHHIGIIYAAHQLAEKLHTGQTRKDDKPYITHIESATAGYIHLRDIDGSEDPIQPQDIVVIMLHDAIEDYDMSTHISGTPTALVQVYTAFGMDIVASVLLLTQMNANVRAQLADAPNIESELSCMGSGNRKGKDTPVYADLAAERFLIENKTVDEVRYWIHTAPISLLARAELSAVWNTYMRDKYTTETEIEKKRDILADIYALYMISILPKREFIMKCADRLHNIADRGGLRYIQQGRMSMKKTNYTTKYIYIRRARELGLYAIAEMLVNAIQGRISQDVQDILGVYATDI